MPDYGTDIYTEAVSDPDTLGASSVRSARWPGCGRAPRATTSTRSPAARSATCSSSATSSQPIDPQTNGPQLFYGLRYHTHIVKPGEVETFHDQVGYWLWEPAAETVTLTLAIPRAQVLLAAGPATADATEFELTAARRLRACTASCRTRSSTRTSAR